MAHDTLLCLKCRRKGHDVSHCDNGSWQDELDWTFSPARKSMENTIKGAENLGTICTRCKGLDLIRTLESYPPWTSQSELSDAYDEDVSDSIHNLGKTGAVQFRADCPVCCCIFAITPNPRSTEQDVLLVVDWSVCRVAGELGIKMDQAEKRHYATCLLSVLKPSSIQLPIAIVAHRNDALCLLAQDIGTQRTLGARRVNSDRLDTSMINRWISKCMACHDKACKPIPTKDLEEVRLIDIKARQVVIWPGAHCEYTALSYVWGDVFQDNYTLGDTIGHLPRTLEDAMRLTQQLGKNYIWIDSVCINQRDEDDKTNQIDRMWSIYRGAYLTIIALSGSSANAGISRLSRSIHCPQVSCNIGGKTIVSLMPTLSQQIWTSSWGQRAWTLQEGLLSPRCLYLSDEQVYFDCESMQICESLDESQSWCHQLQPSSNPTEEGFVTWMLRQAGSGALRIPLDWPSRRLEHWGEKLNLYSYRDMTYNQDALRAFKGVLQRLEAIYPKGFHFGLPIEDLDWALLWRSQVPPKRRSNFPSWTWAGWKGPLFFGQPLDVKKTRRMPIPLKIQSYSEEDGWHAIFHSQSDALRSTTALTISIRNDPVEQAASSAPSETIEFLLSSLPGPYSDYLDITGIVMNFVPDFRDPQSGTVAAGQQETFAFQRESTQCYIRIFSLDSYIPGKWVGDDWAVDSSQVKEWTCLLLARDHLQGFIVHHLMLLNITKDEGVFERGTVFELLLPLNALNILEVFQPRARRILLI